MGLIALLAIVAALSVDQARRARGRHLSEQELTRHQREADRARSEELMAQLSALDRRYEDLSLQEWEGRRIYQDLYTEYIALRGHPPPGLPPPEEEH